MSQTNTSDARVAAESARERLVGDVADVVRTEARTVRSDLADAARPATKGLLLLGAAAGLGVLGIGAATVTTLRVLELFMPRLLAAAGLTAGYFAGATMLAGTAVAKLGEAGGSSERVADQIRDAVTQVLQRPGQAAVSAARESGQ